jgi:hypothetical protein
MRAKIIHVTDHALLRWKQRVSLNGNVKADEIVEMVKKSKVVKKNQPLPYAMPRMNNIVYSTVDNIMFVMEPVSIDEYRLVTVIY